ncbi:MAG: FAD-dependent oxidoreductase [Candidatus Alcyoniella australis]|nr:FAD-dependent oxidoreductase [Candidatus Alcyoniella australis]
MAQQVVFSIWKEQLVDNRDGKGDGSASLEIELPMQLPALGELRAFIGWAGYVLLDPQLHPVALAAGYLKRCQDTASCGKCFPGRVGTRLMFDLLLKLCSGQGTREDIAELGRLALNVSRTSKCQVGQTVPIPILKMLEHQIEAFEELAAGKSVEPLELHAELTAPCIDACPAHLDIPCYVERVGEMDFAGSLQKIRERNCLPATVGRVCVRPCEAACRRALVDEPIQINFLKRYVADDETKRHRTPPMVPRPRLGKRAAIIGCGPAGLACAYNLQLAGVDATLFEALPEGGGMAAVGIPDYRLPRTVLGREIEIIRSLGATIEYGQRLGAGLSIDDLLGEQSFDALFLGVGCHNSRKMGVQGEELGHEGFIHGVKFLLDVNLGRPIYRGDKIVVVGGGNVAIDCVRCALRKGYRDVNLVYRRSRNEMPAADVEIEDALAEGIKFHFLTNPTRLLARDNKIVGIELIRMELDEPDASGRRRPVPIEGSEYTVDADVVIPAIGQQADLSFLTESHGIGVTRWGTIEADPITGLTARQGVFAGGDCVRGPDSLIVALGDGNRAAAAILRYLGGEPVEATLQEVLLEQTLHGLKPFDPDERIDLPQGEPRAGLRHLPVPTRIKTFDEVEQLFSTDEAVREAGRCLRCYRLAGFAV